MGGLTIGALIGAVFGCVWGIAGSSGLPVRQGPWGRLLSVAIFVALMVVLIKRPPPLAAQPAPFRAGIYGLGVCAEVVAIVAVVWYARRYGRKDILLPAIGCIVGLHFIAMWIATGAFIFVWTAIAMCLVSLIALAWPGRTMGDGALMDIRRVFAGWGCAVVLWVTAVALH